MVENYGTFKKEWESYFNNLKNTTSDTKLRWFQFRILHYILTTNRSVSKYKNGQDGKCSFCGAHSETILHLLWKCKYVQCFWNEIALLINRKCVHSHNFKFTQSLVIFGKCNKITTDKICDLIILLAKFFIYRSKVQNKPLYLNFFIKEFYRRYTIEKVISKNSKKFINDWTPYLALFKGILV